MCPTPASQNAQGADIAIGFVGAGRSGSAATSEGFQRLGHFAEPCGTSENPATAGGVPNGDVAEIFERLIRIGAEHETHRVRYVSAILRRAWRNLEADPYRPGLRRSALKLALKVAEAAR